VKPLPNDYSTAFHPSAGKKKEKIRSTVFKMFFVWANVNLRPGLIQGL